MTDHSSWLVASEITRSVSAFTSGRFHDESDQILVKICMHVQKRGKRRPDLGVVRDKMAPDRLESPLGCDGVREYNVCEIRIGTNLIGESVILL